MTVVYAKVTYTPAETQNLSLPWWPWAPPQAAPPPFPHLSGGLPAPDFQFFLSMNLFSHWPFCVAPFLHIGLSRTLPAAGSRLCPAEGRRWHGRTSARLSPVDRRLECFHFLAMLVNAALNIGAHVVLKSRFHFSCVNTWE